jgi:poly-beta-1,6-N-acetyl-D-glucosamine synthase
MNEKRMEAKEMRVVALIPCHNEEELVERVVWSLREQIRPPDQILVVVDNCTDRTPQVARASGADVFLTSGNQDKKARALNQVLTEALPGLCDQDCVLVMDGDSSLAPRFLEIAVDAMPSKHKVGAIGGRTYAKAGSATLRT